MVNHVNLVKLCVGAARVEDLENWVARRAAVARAAGKDHLPTHVTRMWPKRHGEILNGGSLYWVFKGFILARQQILRFDECRGDDGIRRCAIVMSPNIIRTQSAGRRPFQGWRYLAPADSPPDLKVAGERDDELPMDMTLLLAEIGLR